MLDVQRSAPTAPARYASASTPRLFYLAMSLLMLALVTYGFSRTVGPALLNAHRPRHLVLLLSIHGVVFYDWMLLMVVQSALAFTHTALTEDEWRRSACRDKDAEHVGAESTG
jgi:hypothetical protein